MGDVPPAGRDAGDPRPWEAPGSARRDVMPHRGRFLRTLAVVACVLAALSCATLLPALVALPLEAWVLAAAPVVLLYLFFEEQLRLLGR